MTVSDLTGRALVQQRFALTRDVTAAFFDLQADRLSRACLKMAERFQRGGRLFVFGDGAEASDATHVAVEFMHPVLVGKRALPALALAPDAQGWSGRERAPAHDGFARLLETLGRECDIALGLSSDQGSMAVRRGLECASEIGMLTLHLAGGSPANTPAARFTFTVLCDDAMAVQEVHETAYHVLWELVHVFFDHRAT